VRADLDAERFPRERLERRGVPRGGPQLQLRVARRAQLQQVVVAAVVKLEARDRLRVAAIEAFREAQNRGERADGAAGPPAQIPKPLVLAFGRRQPMIPRHERDGFDFVRLEAAQVTVFHEVIGVFMVSLVADVDADVMENRGIFEPHAFHVRQAVNHARLIEQRDGQARHVLRVLGPVAAAFRELEHTAPPHIRIPVGLRDFLAVPRDVIEDQALAQRQIAKRDLFDAEPPQDFVQQDRAGD